MQQRAKPVGCDVSGAALPLDGGFDAAHHRQGLFHAGMLPTLKEHPRNRKGTKRGGTRLCKETLQA